MMLMKFVYVIYPGPISLSYTPVPFYLTTPWMLQAHYMLMVCNNAHYIWLLDGATYFHWRRLHYGPCRLKVET
jgi:hypothetical protein